MVKFVKMEAAGNDFVVLDALAHPPLAQLDFAAFARRWCDRRLGIGSDGLLLLGPPEADAARHAARVRMRMWNPDGSEDMCGNGLRCVGLLAHRRHLGEPAFTVQTAAGLRQVEIGEKGS